MFFLGVNSRGGKHPQIWAPRSDLNEKSSFATWNPRGGVGPILVGGEKHWFQCVRMVTISGEFHVNFDLGMQGKKCKKQELR